MYRMFKGKLQNCSLRKKKIYCTEGYNIFFIHLIRICLFWLPYLIAQYIVMDYLKRGFYVLMLKKFQLCVYSHLRWKIRCDRKPETQLWYSVYYVCMAYSRWICRSAEHENCKVVITTPVPLPSLQLLHYQSALGDGALTHYLEVRMS